MSAAASADRPLEGDDHLLQSAIDRGGTVLLTRSYVITRTLTLRAGTRLIGKPGAKIIWRGPVKGPIIADSSVANPRAVNKGIVLQDFEIAGENFQEGASDQIAIDFYRTAQVIIRNVTVHGVGGSGIRWGNSHIDTTDILVENCTIYDCRDGDAIQGSGRNIVIRNNTIGKTNSSHGNFGDSGIALLHDFEYSTNPMHLNSSNVKIEGNVITGNYDRFGRYRGKGGKSQTGIAFGPFAVGTPTTIQIANNKISRCYVNIWGAVTSEIEIIDNQFSAHAATATANVRLDGVTDVTIARNMFFLEFSSTEPDYSGVMLNAQRNIYGKSVFDADVKRFSVTDNTFVARHASDGIRLCFEQIAIDPPYISRIENGSITDNRFINIRHPVSFAPRHGNRPGVCTDIDIIRNLVDVDAESVVYMAGNPNQYSAVAIRDNRTSPATDSVRGSGHAGTP